MIRQYIGARYVTKIYENTLDSSSAEWQPSVAYEPLTLVTYNNSSYLSKKEVPANIGNPALNPLYWVITGAYNGQIATLQQQINDILNELTVNQRRKIIFVSDSYGLHPSAATSWIAEVVNMLDLDSSDYYAWAEGGAGMIHQGNLGHTFLTLIQSKANTVSDPDSITDIVLVGGVNDAYYYNSYSISNLQTAADTLCSYMRTTYPNAKIRLGMGGNWIDKTSQQANYLMQLPKIYSEAALKNKGCYIENIQYVMHDMTLFDDPQHPLQTGSIELAKCVIANLYGGVYNVEFTRNGTFVTDGDNTISAGNTYLMHTQNGITDIWIGGSGFTLNTPVTTPNNVLLMRFNPRLLACPVSGYCTPNSTIMEGFLTAIPCRYRFEVDDANATNGGKVYFTCSASTTTITGGALGSINISMPTMVL